MNFAVEIWPRFYMDGDTRVLQLGWVGLIAVIILIIWGGYKFYRDINPKKWYNGIEKSWNQPRKFVKAKFRTLR